MGQGGGLVGQGGVVVQALWVQGAGGTTMGHLNTFLIGSCLSSSVSVNVNISNVNVSVSVCESVMQPDAVSPCQE